jgi:hypothetical protein
VLSFCILIGVSVPSGLHAKALLTCNTMTAPMQSHSEMGMSMEHSEAHDFGFACACSIAEAPVKTEVQVVQKVNPAAFSLEAVFTEIPSRTAPIDARVGQQAASYLTPPIFIVNQVFLI